MQVEYVLTSGSESIKYPMIFFKKQRHITTIPGPISFPLMSFGHICMQAPLFLNNFFPSLSSLFFPHVLVTPGLFRSTGASSIYPLPHIQNYHRQGQVCSVWWDAWIPNLFLYATLHFLFQYTWLYSGTTPCHATINYSRVTSQCVSCYKIKLPSSPPFLSLWPWPAVISSLSSLILYYVTYSSDSFTPLSMDFPWGSEMGPLSLCSIALQKSLSSTTSITFH